MPQAGLEMVWLELTSFCNLECIHCYANSGPHGKHAVLTEQDYCEIISEASQLGCKRLQFIGGEPTAVKYLPTLVAYARTVGIPSVEVFTNATLLNEKILASFSANQVNVFVSFYSADRHAHDAITKRVGSFQETVDGLRRLVQLEIPTTVCIIEMDENRTHFEETKSFLNDIGVYNIHFDSIRHLGRGASDARPSGSDPGLNDQCQSALPFGDLCGQCGNGRLAVLPDGSVSPCVMSRSQVVGSTREQSLHDLLQSVPLKKFQSLLRQFGGGGVTIVNGETGIEGADETRQQSPECSPNNPKPQSPQCSPNSPQPFCSPGSPEPQSPQCSPNSPKPQSPQCSPNSPQPFCSPGSPEPQSPQCSPNTKSQSPQYSPNSPQPLCSPGAPEPQYSSNGVGGARTPDKSVYLSLPKTSNAEVFHGGNGIREGANNFASLDEVFGSSEFGSIPIVVESISQNAEIYSFQMLSDDFCEALLQSISNLEYQDSAIIGGRSDYYRTSQELVAGNYYKEFEARFSSLALPIFSSVAKSIWSWECNTIVDLSLVRYGPGSYFKEHVDAYDAATQAGRHITFIVYLSDDFEGGQTFFRRQAQTVSPRRGRALLFPAGITHPHEGKMVTSGTKFAIVGWLARF